MRSRILLAALVVALTGCVKVEVEFTEGPPQGQDFAAAAEPICAERNVALRSLPKPKGRAQAIRNAERAAAAERLVIAQLAALETTPSIRPDVERFLAAERELLAATERWSAARRSGDVYALATATNQAQLAGRNVTLAASRLGVTSCAQG